jgi:hypothetical protein
MWVLWVSNSSEVPIVQYSTTPLPATAPGTLFQKLKPGQQPMVDSAVHTMTGSSGTYYATDMCSAPANQTGQQLYINPGFMHRVLLSGLQADTDYYYMYGTPLHGFSAHRTLLVFRQMFSLEDGIGSHACSREALSCM